MIRGILFIAALTWISTALPAEERFDVVLAGGRVVDGTGSPWYVADIGIRDGKIVRIGRINPPNPPFIKGGQGKSPLTKGGKEGLPLTKSGSPPAKGGQGEAQRRIDVSGLIVAPGFIDMMGQTATPMLNDPKAALNLLTQGITTINAGEGVSAAPLGAESSRSAGWQTMAEYFQLLELRGLPVNVVQTVGHTQVRRIVLGEADRRPSDEEMRRMKQLVAEAMEAGAIGLSTALIYPPAVYAPTQEIAELAAVAGKYGGRYYTHMRNEGDRLLEAIEEALDIGRTAGTGVHIFHLKAAGRQNWAKMEQAIAHIKAARAAGQQVTADIYPYVNNGLGISAFIHPRHSAAGHAQLLRRLDDSKLRAEIRKEMEETSGWENWYRHVGGDWHKVIIGQTADKRYAALAGKSLAEMAKARKEDPWDTFFNLVKAGAFALPESMLEANLVRALREEFISFCTDVGPAAGSNIASHPRAFGAFPRLLSRYARDLGVISLPRAAAQASAAAANDIMVYDRGRIAEGLAADIIAFDYDKLADRATFAEPARLSEGVKYVLVNGQVVFDDGRFTGARPGRVLRGPGYRSEFAPHAVSTGKADRRMASFDRLMREFMKQHRVPGAALAVTDKGRLVYARGYGYADIGQREKVTPESLFRIASISKPITAVAILQLVEQKRLSLDDKVFDILEHKAYLAPPLSKGGPPAPPNPPLPPLGKGGNDLPPVGKGGKFDERQRQITIRHLLEHRGGWDRDVSFDGMFRSVDFAKTLGVPPPAGPAEVIRSMLARPLDFDPGQRYAYSNYGYCLLGRVIEKITGKTYEDYVKEQVLAPLGIRSMRIGKTLLAGRQPGEVRYYDPSKGLSVFAADLGQQVPHPYGAWYLEAMDAHGGWIASAIDLARFACVLDDPHKCKILKPKSIDAMFARPHGLAGHDKDGKPKDVFYSLGWMNRVAGEGKIHRWHTGSLPGTATLLVRRHDGRNWAVLFNARVSPQSEHLTRAIDGLLHKAADEVTQWPQEDLFPEFAAHQ